MAEHGEIVAGATGVGAMLAGFWAAWKSFKPAPAPEKGNDMGALLQRMADMERRQGDADRRMDDVFDLLGGVKDSLSQVQVDVREALSRLDERRRK